MQKTKWSRCDASRHPSSRWAWRPMLFESFTIRPPGSPSAWFDLESQRISPKASRTERTPKQRCSSVGVANCQAGLTSARKRLLRDVLLVGYDCRDDDPIRAVPCHGAEADTLEESAGPTPCSNTVPTTQQKGRHQPRGEQIGENEGAPCGQNAKALTDSGILVLPVVERRCADDEVEIPVSVGKVFRCTHREAEASILRPFLGNGDHPGRCVNTEEFLAILWEAVCEEP
jgi:hypothetical protein